MYALDLSSDLLSDLLVTCWSNRSLSKTPLYIGFFRD